MINKTSCCNSRQDCAGFTLIEVMVTVAIIAILASIALPSYSDYLTRGRIPDATAALSTKRVIAEQYFQDHRTYKNTAGDVNQACVADTTTSKYFTFTCPVQDDLAVTIQATGGSSMAGFNYTIDQSNAKASTITATGWTGNATCWVTKKGGAC